MKLIWYTVDSSATGDNTRSAFPGCNAQIKIELNDMDKALDDINTLIQIQSAVCRKRPAA